MKVLLSIFFITFFATSPPELAKLRIDYVNANGNKMLIEVLIDELSEVTKNDKKVFVAYKGAVLTMQSKYVKGKERKELFKQGISLIEYAVTSDPNNIEIRVIRLSIQENVPKLLKYNANISDDKEFILSNYRIISSKGVKDFVRRYVMQSESFSSSEKELF